MHKLAFYAFVFCRFINHLSCCETLYSGKDILVEASSFGSKNIWICFDAIKAVEYGAEFQEGSQTHFKSGSKRWGQPFLGKSGIDAINVVSLSNHWYQTEEMKVVLPIITKYIQGKTYENVITYGLSMGGYGAVLFSEQLKANRVLALAPQLQLKDIDRIGLSVWQQLLKLQPIFTMPKHFNSCDFYVLFGFGHKIDRSIVEDPDGLPLIVSDPKKRHIFPFNTPDHNVADFLLQHSLLKQVVSLVDKGDHDGLLKCLDPFIDKPEPSKFLGRIGFGKRFDPKSPVRLESGFFWHEEEGIWSSAKVIFSLIFPKAGKQYKINIDYHAFVNEKNPVIDFRLKDEKEGLFKGSSKGDSNQSVCSFMYKPDVSMTRFTLEADQANSPLHLGISKDMRVLGLFFKSIVITEI